MGIIRMEEEGKEEEVHSKCLVVLVDLVDLAIPSFRRHLEMDSGLPGK